MTFIVIICWYRIYQQTKVRAKNAPKSNKALITRIVNRNTKMEKGGTKNLQKLK